MPALPTEYWKSSGLCFSCCSEGECFRVTNFYLPHLTGIPEFTKLRTDHCLIVAAGYDGINHAIIGKSFNINTGVKRSSDIIHMHQE